MVANVHQRRYAAASADVVALVFTLASKDDRLWPYESWPRMRLDPGLVVGAGGGHGPVRYRVERIEPTGEVVFRFTGPSGFDGWHAFSVVEVAPAATMLRHELRMRVRGLALLSWPLFFRPLHDALIEEAFDKAARELEDSSPRTPHRRSSGVRLLLWVAESIGRIGARRREHPGT